jgi:uncharacterized membrane protein SirB2
MLLYLYVAARFGAFLLLVAYIVLGARRARSGSTARAAPYFLAALLCLLVSGFLAIL